MFDAEDREVLASIVIRVLVGVGVVLITSATLGLGWRIFWVLAG